MLLNPDEQITKPSQSAQNVREETPMQEKKRAYADNNSNIETKGLNQFLKVRNAFS